MAVVNEARQGGWRCWFAKKEKKREGGGGGLFSFGEGRSNLWRKFLAVDEKEEKKYSALSYLHLAPV